MINCGSKHFTITCMILLFELNFNCCWTKSQKGHFYQFYLAPEIYLKINKAAIKMVFTDIELIALCHLLSNPVL